jgi:enoyl-CoA hydratase/carnithine racemase
MSGSHVTLERVGDAVGLLRFESGLPDNAITFATLRDLRDRVDEVSSSDLRVLTLTGSRDVFTAGADLGEMAGRHEAYFMELVRTEFDLYRRLEELPMPTIAALCGLCVGTGAELALACDLRVADPSCRISFPESRLGFAGPAARLSRHVGMGRAKDILLSGRGVPAEEAYAMGLITKVVDVGTQEAEALRLATRLSRVPASGVRRTKAHVAGVYHMADIPEHAMMEGALEAFRSAELQEALASLMAGALDRGPTG